MTIDFSDKKTLEKYSSAFTLSDMEIFIFPELFYPLVMANIMSPIIWKWREDPWFADIREKSFNYKVNRIKQYIIDNYVFNLDLATWGLTTKTREIERFRDFFDVEVLRRSNALFGYEGDKYYFDIDIRKHFGLDKFNSDVIPYWKTETVEAMTAFRHKENFTTGAGECVSLSALYAAAMFIVAGIPLEKIFLIATPLHSQNFITEKEGVITNNRRIVTKNMWFNGTSLSEKARRALENERVTMVSHISGYMHTIYRDATINRKCYKWFSGKLRDFLSTELTDRVFINFLRFKSKYKSLFQVECTCSGISYYISLEKMLEYEHTSKFSASPDTREKLIGEIEGDEFHLSPLPGKIILNRAEEILGTHKNSDLKELEILFTGLNGEIKKDMIREMFEDLAKFITTRPNLPEEDKNYIDSVVPEISVNDSREQIIEKIHGHADRSEMALLTLYAYRQMDKADWLPFVKAAIERNPTCFGDLNGKSIREVYEILTAMPDESVYDGKRLALPDEIWNFKRGDGLEKAFLLAVFITGTDPAAEINIVSADETVRLSCSGNAYLFRTKKNFRKHIRISGSNYEIS
ncbi:MAG TPA: hypothetical protein PLZ75_11580 [Bacteroidales bacterium]|jgi:hypothetical protein|nr:hypothetical protein [Bacteroidales bacterium]HQH24848.1 hypothetical protein [Bacteroidales bacterium]HQJ81855.1 hypothetical protein [Bacteroidales bacterium]